MKRTRRGKTEYPFTYAEGPTYETEKNFTYDDLIQVCEELTKVLKTTVIPEGIQEGGLLFSDLPYGQYKSFRFRSPFGTWPFISKNWMEEAQKTPDVVIWPVRTNPWTKTIKPNRIGTFLKAFYGAPTWTTTELNAIALAFKKIGLELKKTTKPNTLISYDADLGIPKEEKSKAIKK